MEHSEFVVEGIYGALWAQSRTVGYFKRKWESCVYELYREVDRWKRYVLRLQHMRKLISFSVEVNSADGFVV